MTELTAVVADLAHDGVGICKVEDQTYFVDGVLPGEEVTFLRGKKRKGKRLGSLVSILSKSPDRVDPYCSYFGVCGGCALQHLSREAQISYKQDVLQNNLQKLGRVTAEKLAEPIVADSWKYRRKARPGIKLVPKKGGILVGFRERGSSFLTSLHKCHTLNEPLSDLLAPLHELITGLSHSDRFPQVEIAQGDNAISIVLRHLEALTDNDLESLKQFACRHKVQMYLQPGNLKSIHPLWPENPQPLKFSLQRFGIELEFSATDFVQVNADINERIVSKALALLKPQTGEKILDLFCGLGNFTLPIAKSGAEVVGIEGEQALVDKAVLNASRNRLTNVTFERADLHNSEHVARLKAHNFDKMLIDPPRSGAREICEHLIPVIAPQRIVYVSCNPATLARDADYLVNQHGYQLIEAGIADMFPHTAHVESIALFDRAGS
ncbi:MAG: 23S rRNA (uracil(1939)-C(5))-methyltransferase RlmD [Pseudomonadota bacterium]